MSLEHTEDKNVPERVAAYMEQYKMLKEQDRVVLGVSGGADSVALFHIFVQLQKRYQLRLFVVHVHHGIREEAGEDAQFVKEL